MNIKAYTFFIVLPYTETLHTVRALTSYVQHLSSTLCRLKSPCMYLLIYVLYMLRTTIYQHDIKPTSVATLEQFANQNMIYCRKLSDDYLFDVILIMGIDSKNKRLLFLKVFQPFLQETNLNICTCKQMQAKRIYDKICNNLGLEVMPNNKKLSCMLLIIILRCGQRRGYRGISQMNNCQEKQQPAH